MSTIKCVVRPQNSVNLTVEKEYNGARFFTRDMEAVSRLEDATFVTITNDRGSNQRYRQSLFVPVRNVDVQVPIPEPVSVTITETTIMESFTFGIVKNERINVRYELEAQANSNRIRLEINSRFNNRPIVNTLLNLGVSFSHSNSYSCGITTMVNVEAMADFITNNITEEYIKSIINSSFPDADVIIYPNNFDNIIRDLQRKCFSDILRNVMNILEDGSAFLQLSVTEQSSANSFLNNIVDIQAQNLNINYNFEIDVIGPKKNPNSDNNILIYVLSTLND